MTNPASEQTPEIGAPTAVPVLSWHLSRMFAAWAFAAAFGTVVSLLAPEALRFEWLAMAVGASALATFALQLGTAQREGFIIRTSFSIAGATVIIAGIDIFGLLVA